MKDRDVFLVRETARSYGNESDLLTYDDYLRMPEGLRYELLEGELLMTPSPNTLHQTASKRLGRLFMEQLEDTGLGKVFIAPFDVVLSEHNVAQPDILFISKDRLGIIGELNVQGAPDLVVEILSESTSSRDRVTKRRVYSQYGVREYWIVDANAKTIEVAARKEANLTPAGVYHAGETILSPSYPGLAIDVTPLFAE